MLPRSSGVFITSHNYFHIYSNMPLLPSNKATPTTLVPKSYNMTVRDQQCLAVDHSSRDVPLIDRCKDGIFLNFLWHPAGAA
jgi:hypothetical protein